MNLAIMLHLIYLFALSTPPQAAAVATAATAATGRHPVPCIGGVFYLGPPGKPTRPAQST